MYARKRCLLMLAIIDISRLACGFFMSFSVKPVAYNIACDAPCDFGCVICRLYLFRFAGTGSEEAGIFCSCSTGSGVAIVARARDCLPRLHFRRECCATGVAWLVLATCGEALRPYMLMSSTVFDAELCQKE